MNLCLNFDHGRLIARLTGELQHTQLKVTDLAMQLAEKEDQVRELMNWLLHINGAPSAFEASTVTAPAKVSPFAGVSNARDFKRIAEELESRATSQQP